MRETWLRRTIFFVAFAVSVALAFVPGAKEVGQSDIRSLAHGPDLFEVLMAILGAVALTVLLVRAAMGDRPFWLLAFALIILRTLWDLSIAFDEMTALTWATSGASVLVALTLWSLKPVDAFNRQRRVSVG